MFKGIEFKDEQAETGKGMVLYDLVKLTRFNGSTLLVDSINNELETNKDYNIIKDKQGRIEKIENPKFNQSTTYEYNDDHIIENIETEINMSRGSAVANTVFVIDSPDNIYGPLSSRTDSRDGYVYSVQEYGNFCGMNYLSKKTEFNNKNYHHIDYTMREDPVDTNRVDRIDYYKDSDNIDYSLVCDEDSSEFNIEKDSKIVSLSELIKNI